MKMVAVLLADGAEEIEAVTVIDILRRAGVQVSVVGLTGDPVEASRGVRLVPDSSLEQVQDESFDAVVLPGGAAGADRLAEDARVHDLLKRTFAEGRLVAAICAAPKVLKAAGILTGRRVTSYPGHLNPGDEDYTYVEEPVVRDGNILTSRGPGTAMDFALSLVQALEGYSARRKVEAPLLRSR